ncbi:MAG: hypothetical protein ACLFPF_09455 [Halanaerobiales bacterium]
MKIGFAKDGILFNSKKINPLNISVSDFGVNLEEDYGVESDMELVSINPFELLEELAEARYNPDKRLNNGREIPRIDVLESLFDNIF